MEVTDILSWIFIIIGSVFLLIGGIGVLRLPDVFTRMHAAGITDTLGADAIIIGLIIQAGPNLVAIKLALMLLFVFFASPTATHALAQAALSVGVRPKLDDDLREDQAEGSDPSKT
jgi:multicomponent Na+:H+ antiporter subunit G